MQSANTSNSDAAWQLYATYLKKVRESKKSPPPKFSDIFFQNSWEVLVQILHAYYTFLSTLECKFLFN